MAQIKFGLGQIATATPSIIGRLRKALNYLSASIVVFLPFIAERFKTTTDVLTTWLGLIMVGFNFIAEFFGAPITTETVPKDDVTEVKTS